MPPAPCNVRPNLSSLSSRLTSVPLATAHTSRNLHREPQFFESNAPCACGSAYEIPHSWTGTPLRRRSGRASEPQAVRTCCKGLAEARTRTKPTPMCRFRSGRNRAPNYSPTHMSVEPRRGYRYGPHNSYLGEARLIEWRSSQGGTTTFRKTSES